MLDFDILAKDTIRTLKIPAANIPKPLCIIMVGFPTSGKSTLVEKLKDRFPLADFSEEQLTAFLAPRASVVRRDSSEVFQLATKIIENLMAMSRACVYDSNIKTKEQRDLIKKVVEDGGGSFLLVYLECPKQVCYDRLQKHNLGVSRGEAKGFILDKDLFEYEISTTHLPSPEEQHLTLKCDDPESLSQLYSMVETRLQTESF